MDVKWDQKTKEHFDQIITNLPQFHRSIAEQLVKESAESLARERNSQSVQENDLVIAFFNEVPPAFKDMMKRLFNQQGIDYTKYVKE
ncbi:MAG: DUF2621 family protein [Candidatus Omnitrophica bacterium]|nr:DUF2621 family protein [Candidatus Omnitrophota bacterium]MBU2250699.1 DUF2621 family protein [Candidatus Omnitrophota bacterium]MBU2473116.1 DUF2621 family protein [Candidatus Omnitrophota bacterium]